MNAIKAVALDVDGVLTDDAFWWGPNGEAFQRFSVAEGRLAVGEFFPENCPW